MNWINFLSTKAFRYISGGVFLIIALAFAYDKFETAVTNNTVLRSNLAQKDKQIEALQNNLKMQELRHKEELKALQFDSKVKTKKDELQKKVDTFKKPIKEIKKDEIIITDSPVYFTL